MRILYLQKPFDHYYFETQLGIMGKEEEAQISPVLGFLFLSIGETGNDVRKIRGESDALSDFGRHKGEPQVST